MLSFSHLRRGVHRNRMSGFGCPLVAICIWKCCELLQAGVLSFSHASVPSKGENVMSSVIPESCLLLYLGVRGQHTKAFLTFWVNLAKNWFWVPVGLFPHTFILKITRNYLCCYPHAKIKERHTVSIKHYCYLWNVSNIVFGICHVWSGIFLSPSIQKFLPWSLDYHSTKW